MTTNVRSLSAAGKWSLVALALALGLGILGQAAHLAPVRGFSRLLEPVGALWLQALQMVVLPLVTTQLLAALVRPGPSGGLVRTGGRAFGLSMAYLVGGGILLVAVAPPLLETLFHTPDLTAVLSPDAVPAAAREAAAGGTGSQGGWLVGLVPTNVFQAAAEGRLLQLIVFLVLLGLAASRLPEEQRSPLAHLVRSLADAVMILVGWILRLTPLGVFCLLLAFSLDQGMAVMGLLGIYVLSLSGILLGMVALLYPLSSLAGAVSVVRFAKAVMPAQVVAAGTQSSLASLPALVEGGGRELDLPGDYTGFVLPFCVSTFRFNSPVSETFNLLFLASAFGVSLSPGDIGVFMLGILILSFSISGVPRGGGAFQSLPFYLAAGVPIEGVVLLEMVKTLPDVFFTLYNVTVSMSVATILSAGNRGRVRAPRIPAWLGAGKGGPPPVVLGGRPVARQRHRYRAGGPAVSGSAVRHEPPDSPGSAADSWMQ